MIVTADQLEAARAKVNNPGSWSNSLFAPTQSAAQFGSLPPTLFQALDASQPMVALLAATPQDRATFAQKAIDMSVAAINAFEPPYPDSTRPDETDCNPKDEYPPICYPEWYGRYIYRYLALTYDATYDKLGETPGLRESFQDELLRIAAWLGSSRIEEDPNNHKVVFDVDLALIAYALHNDDNVAAPRVIAYEPVVRSGTSTSDFLRYRSEITNVSISATNGGPPAWTGGASPADYEVQFVPAPSGQKWNHGRKIVWHSTHPPAPGTTYYVSYTFTPNFPVWKERARLGMQRHLDNMWSEGSSAAGVFYGSWAMGWMLDAFEAIRNTTGVDYAQHPAVRDAVLWHPTELIAPKSPGSLRVNNRNDMGYDDLDGTFAAGAPTYWAWVLSRYASDPGGRDKVAYWLLQHSTRWYPPGVYFFRQGFWREALWVNESFNAHPPPLDPAPALTLPLSRFFSGHNMANFRTGAWDGQPSDWSLFSLAAGPTSFQEHIQADRGAFTFYALGQEFAIDTGYSGESEPFNQTYGHNYILVDHPRYQRGTCTQIGSTDAQDISGGAEIRSSVVSSIYDAVDADLRKSYLSSSDLPMVADPPCWPVGTADRSAVFVKRPGRAPFAIVSDSLDVNGTSRTAAWQMHTAPGNAIAINGSTARVTIDASGTKPTLDVTMAAAAPLTLTSEDVIVTYPSQAVPTHKKLVARATAANARFLAILVPEQANEPSPLVVPPPVSSPDNVFATVSGGGLVDTILQNRTAGSTVSASGLVTDGSLAVVRTDGSGQVLGWLVQNATFLTRSGVDLWRVNAPVAMRGSASYDGAALTVSAKDAMDFRAWAPAATSFDGPNGTMAAPNVGGQLHWAGSRRLFDTSPAGGDAFTETFSNSVAANWLSYFFDAKFDRVVDGELCSQGFMYYGQLISHTKRTYNLYRADTYQAPRGIFGDATQTGKFTVYSPGGEPKVKIMGRVVDRTTYPEGSYPHVLQDYVKVEVDVGATGGVALKARRGELPAAETTLWSGGGPVSAGSPHTYALSIQGNVVTFTLDGQQVFNVTDTTGAVPPAGYFQWQVPGGQHVHFDDVHVILPGTSYACTSDSECDDGLFCTQDLCNPSTHTCGHPPVSCPNLEPHCRVPYCNEAGDYCSTQPIVPTPPPWRCGSHWCICDDLLE